MTNDRERPLIYLGSIESKNNNIQIESKVQRVDDN